jgi:hypothetical protein
LAKVSFSHRISSLGVLRGNYIPFFSNTSLI